MFKSEINQAYKEGGGVGGTQPFFGGWRLPEQCQPLQVKGTGSAVKHDEIFQDFLYLLCLKHEYLIIKQYASSCEYKTYYHLNINFTIFE